MNKKHMPQDRLSTSVLQLINLDERRRISFLFSTISGELMKCCDDSMLFHYCFTESCVFSERNLV